VVAAALTKNDATATANYNITVDIGGAGTGSVTVTGTGYTQTVTSTTLLSVPASAGANLTFTASTTGTNVFVSFTQNAGTPDTSSPQTYAVANGDTIYAVFDANANVNYNIKVDITGTGSVTVTGTGYTQTVSVTSTLSVPVSAGYSLMFTASAVAPSVFLSFTLNSGTTDLTSPQTYTVANGDTVYAVFDSTGTSYGITVDVSGTGTVTVTGAGGFTRTVTSTTTFAVPGSAGNDLTFTASTTGTNVFASFKLNSGTPDTSSPQTYTVANGNTIYAVFDPNANVNYKITVDIRGTGTGMVTVT
jgi:hypothetical protein